MKKIVRGNDFTLRIPVRKMVNGEQVAVSELNSIEEVEKYDITAGYPAQLRMEV